MTLDEIKAEIKSRGGNVKGMRNPGAILEKLNSMRAAKGESPATLSDGSGSIAETVPTPSPDDEEKMGDVEITMMRNIKSDKFYQKGTTYRVNDDTAELFKTKGWAK